MAQTPEVRQQSQHHELCKRSPVYTAGGSNQNAGILNAQFVDHLPNARTRCLHPFRQGRVGHVGGKVEKDVGTLQPLTPKFLLIGSPREWNAMMIRNVPERRLQICPV
jgi:hypothetical protein